MAVASIRRATVLGLGRFGGGVAAARYLAHTGTAVTISDQASADELADSIAQLADVAIARWQLGGHCDRDVRDADLVVVNPAIPPSHPQLQLAQRLGVPVTTEIELFLQACPARVAGVTGTHGKSTTSAMLAAILEAAGMRVWLGGNIGHSLLPKLPQLAADDWVVLELSSFQLARLSGETRVADLAVITGCSEDHLQWHGGRAAYCAAKQRLLQFQQPGDLAVLNVSDEEVSSWTGLVRGECILPVPIESLPALRVPGAHNQTNASLAAAAALAIGIDRQSVNLALSRYAGLPYRIFDLGSCGGVRFYNAAAATTPAATAAALAAVPAPVWLLAGGADKGLPLEPLCDAVGKFAAGVILYGRAAPAWREVLADRVPQRQVEVASDLHTAMSIACQYVSPPASILCSPGCASYDQFANFLGRGELFTSLVDNLRQQGWQAGRRE